MKIKLILLCACTLFLVSCKDDADPSVLEGCCGNLPLNAQVGEITHIYIANIFTPNGDGINDLMMLNGSIFLNVTAFELKDKEGNVVHSYSSDIGQKDFALWNGEIDGEIKKGFYTYSLTVVTFDGTEETFEGGICNYPCDVDIAEERISADNCTFSTQTFNGYFDSTIPSGEQNGCFAE